MKRLTLDFETKSRCELKKAGAYKYSLDPSTKPTCLAFKKAGNPKVYFLDYEMVNTPWKQLPERLQALWVEAILEGFLFVAHNAFFETCIYKNILVKRYGWPDIPFRQFRCTAAKAAACALPRNLEGAGHAMRLTTQKDKAGYIAMMKTCKPTRQWNDWQKLKVQFEAGKDKRWAAKTRERFERGEPPVFCEPEHDPEIWAVLYKYCKIDVVTEELLDMSLPDLIPMEQEQWFHNQKLNWRGLKIDIPTVTKIVNIMSAESGKRLKELDSLTMGLVTKPGARKSILDFLALEGIELPDIRAKTVDDALNSDELSEDMRRLLEIRKALSKTSTKKYQSFIDRAMPDFRVRDILLYHGASTGRDTGTGIQPHNFPRGVVQFDKADPYWYVNTISESDSDWLQMLFGETMPMVFSSILRNMIVPGDGKELFVADFSKIEVAVLWWLADNVPGLKVLRSGKDPYIYMASANTGRPYEEFNDESPERQLGKAQVLGCGFGMGWVKFLATAWDQYRLKLTDEQAQNAVSNYRTANESVPILWRAYENAAITAVQNAGQMVVAGKCEFRFKAGFLWVKLPSGRSLAYRDPQISMRVPQYEVTEYFYKGKWRQKAFFDRQVHEGNLFDDEMFELKSQHRTVYGEPRETLEFWAVNSKTKKWALERTWGGTLTENIVQATARDLMMPAMVRLEKHGYLSLLMVHDEGICEKNIGEGSIEEFVKIMTESPAWAKGLPLEAKGWKGERYRK